MEFNGGAFTGLGLIKPPNKTQLKELARREGSKNYFLHEHWGHLGHILLNSTEFIRDGPSMELDMDNDYGVAVRLEMSLSRRFKEWEILVCHKEYDKDITKERISRHITNTAKNIYLDDDVKREIIHSEGVPQDFPSRNGRKQHRVFKMEDNKLRNASCLAGKWGDEGRRANYSPYGCAFNTLAFLGVIPVRDAKKEINRLMASNDRKGINSKTIFLSLIKRNKAKWPRVNFPRIMDWYITFSDKPKIERDEGVPPTNRRLSDIYYTFLFIKTMLDGCRDGDKNCIVVKMMLRPYNARARKPEPLGHTVLFCLDHEGDLVLCDPQVGKFVKTFSPKGIQAIDKNYWGFIIFIVNDKAISRQQFGTYLLPCDKSFYAAPVPAAPVPAAPHVPMEVDKPAPVSAAPSVPMEVDKPVPAAPVPAAPVPAAPVPAAPVPAAPDVQQSWQTDFFTHPIDGDVSPSSAVTTHSADATQSAPAPQQELWQTNYYKNPMDGGKKTIKKKKLKLKKKRGTRKKRKHSMEKTQSSHSIKNIGVEIEDKRDIEFADDISDEEHDTWLKMLKKDSSKN